MIVYAAVSCTPSFCLRFGIGIGLSVEEREFELRMHSDSSVGEERDAFETGGATAVFPRIGG